MTHIVKPFTTRIRFAPEVACRPERLQKDLVNIRKLAALLEAEAGDLRKLKVESKQSSNPEDIDANGAPKDGDATMEDTVIEHDEDPEPRERGSDAVERRVEKVMSDMREQGVLESCGEEEVEAKRVSSEEPLADVQLTHLPF